MKATKPFYYINNLTQQLKREIKGIRDKCISSHLRKLTNERTTHYSLWKATKKLKRPIVQISPVETEDGTWAKSSEQKQVNLRIVFSYI